MQTTAAPRKNHYTVIINPSTELAVLLHASPLQDGVLIFSDVSGYERWRQGEEEVCRTIHREVHEVLSQLAVEPGSLCRELRHAIEFLCSQPRVPELRTLFRVCRSERTLYRIWSSAIPETPSKFLRRVRVLHAIRLREYHLHTAKLAAFESGFSDPSILRRALRAR